jgi:hypothetical protein
MAVRVDSFRRSLCCIAVRASSRVKLSIFTATVLVCPPCTDPARQQKTGQCGMNLTIIVIWLSYSAHGNRLRKLCLYRVHYGVHWEPQSKCGPTGGATGQAHKSSSAQSNPDVTQYSIPAWKHPKVYSKLQTGLQRWYGGFSRRSAQLGGERRE